MRIEIWSDVVCPWCYLGKRRLERALAGFEHADEVDIVWRSFQLDPTITPGTREPVYDHLAAKTGGSPADVRAMTAHVGRLAAAEGLDYDFDNAVSVNTFDAHRLTHLAKAHGLGPAMHERLLRAQLIEGATLDDPGTLVRLAGEVGVPTEAAERALAGDDYADAVREDITEARRLGVNGVPFFVLDRTFGVSGAQSAEVFGQALRQAYERVRAAATG